VTELQVYRVSGTEAEQARGVVLAIDVIRAFTVAAYALAGGARRLWLVRRTDEAFWLRRDDPGALLAGEIKGRLIPGFDLNNSPALMARADVRGHTVIQCTGAGTQAAVRAIHASHLLVCSLVNASATARFGRRLAEMEGEPICLLPTAGMTSPEMIEDSICADYLEALMCDPDRAQSVLDAGVERLRTSGRLDVFTADDADFPVADVEHFLAVDRFSFAMVGVRKQSGDVQYVEVERPS
jgi:2-phosphosulfolactate phosphatase